MHRLPSLATTPLLEVPQFPHARREIAAPRNEPDARRLRGHRAIVRATAERRNRPAASAAHCSSPGAYGANACAHRTGTRAGPEATFRGAFASERCRATASAHVSG